MSATVAVSRLEGCPVLFALDYKRRTQSQRFSLVVFCSLWSLFAMFYVLVLISVIRSG